MSNLALNIAVKAQNQTQAAYAQVAAAQARVKLAVDQAKLSYDRYVQAMNSAKATQAQMQNAASQVALALDRVKIAEANVTAATERARGAQQQMAMATKQESGALSLLREHLGGASEGLLGFASKLGMVIFGIQGAIGLVRGLIDGMIRLGSAMIAPNAAMEQSKIAWTTLLGNGEQAQQMLTKLWNFAARTPFQFTAINEAAQKLRAFGIQTQNIIPLLTAMGDSLSALGRTTPAALQGVASIFGKITTQGRMMTRDMMMFSNWGINAWAILEKQLHLTHAQLAVMITKGLLPAGKAIEALRKGMEGTFTNAMLKQAYTFNGLLTTVKDNLQAAWRAMTGPLFNTAKQGLTDLFNLVSSDAFQQFATMIGGTVAPAFERIGYYIGQAASALTKWLQSKSGMDTIKNAALGLKNALNGVWDMILQINKHMPDFVNAFNKGRDSLDLTRYAGDQAKGSMKGLGEVLGQLLVIVGYIAGAIVGFVNTTLLALKYLAIGLNAINSAENTVFGGNRQMIDISAFDPVTASYGPGSASGNFGPVKKGSTSSPGAGLGDTGGLGTGTGRGGRGGVKTQVFTATDITDILKNAKAMHLKFNEQLFKMLSANDKIKYLWDLVGQHMDKLDKLMSDTHGGLLAYLQWILTGKKGPGLILDNGASGTPGSGSTKAGSSGRYNAQFILVNNITINAGTADSKQLYDLLLKRLERDLRRSGNISSMLSGGKSQ